MPPIPVFQNWKRSSQLPVSQPYSLSSASLRWPRLSPTTSLLQSDSCGECFESHCRHVKKYMAGTENFRRLHRIKTCAWVLICSGAPWKCVDSAQHPVFHWTERLCQPSTPGPHQRARRARRCAHSLRSAASASWLSSGSSPGSAQHRHCLGLGSSSSHEPRLCAQGRWQRAKRRVKQFRLSR